MSCHGLLLPPFTSPPRIPRPLRGSCELSFRGYIDTLVHVIVRPNATEPVPASDLAPSNQTVIIGSALGGAFGGVVVVLLAFFVVRRRRQAKRSAVDLDSEFSFDEVSTLASVHPFPLTAAPQQRSVKGAGHAYHRPEKIHSHGIPARTPSRSGSVTSVTLSARPSSRIGSDDGSMNSCEKDPFKG